MTIITPTPIASLPNPPVKGQAGFNAAIELYLASLVNPFTPQVNAAIAATNANALSAEQSAISAAAAAAGANVNLWDVATVYAVGTVVKSPAALSAGASNPIYICKVATAGTHIDPYLDATHWSIFTITGATGGAVYTTSTTLTASSPFSISISGGAGVWLKLPDATQLSTGLRHAVRNTGDNDLTLIDASGAHIGFIRPQSGTTITLSDNSTAAGKWAGDWESVGITADLQFGAAIAGLQNVKQIVQLDATRTMILTGGSSGQGLYAVVYDTATQSAGAAVLVRAAISGAMAIKSATDQALVASFDSGNIYAVALSVSGTAITVNTSATTTITGAFSSTGYFVSVGGAFACSYFTTSGIVRAITISGTTASIGGEQIAGASGAPRLYATGSILRAVRVSSGATVICTPYSISGNTLTAGTAASTTTAANETAVRSFQYSGGDIGVFHAYGGYYVESIFKLTNTTEAVLSTNIRSHGSLVAGSISINNYDYSIIDSNRILFGCALNSDYSVFSVNITTNTSGTPSAGTALDFTNSSTYAAVNEIKSSALNEFGFVLSGLNSMLFDCSGLNPVRTKEFLLTSKVFGNLINGLYYSKNTIGIYREMVCVNSHGIYSIGAYTSSMFMPIYALDGFGAKIPCKITPLLRGNPVIRGENNQTTWVVTAMTSSPEGSLGVALQRVEVAQI